MLRQGIKPYQSDFDKSKMKTPKQSDQRSERSAKQIHHYWQKSSTSLGKMLPSNKSAK